VIVACSTRRTAPGAQQFTDALSFIAFERAGVGLLLFHAHVVKDVENRPALYFKLSR
jgi:hypothetical protein